MGWRAIAVVVASVGGWGCGFETGGVGSEGSGVADGDGTVASSGTSTTSTTAADEASAEGEGTTTSVPMTSGTTASSATTMDPSTTTVPTTGPNTGPSTTGGAEGGSTDSVGSDPVYPPCEAPYTADQCPANHECITIGSNMVVQWSICGATGCFDSGDCPNPGGGDATPLCVANPTFCVLACEVGVTQCPTGTECIQTRFGGRCAWPI